MKEVRSLYIHFPWCEHLCNYCDFFKNVLPEESKAEEYAKLEEYFDRSWQVHAEFLSHHGLKLNNLETIFIGGGTPSLWGTEGINFLKSLFKKFDVSLSSNIEFTIEANPSSGVNQNLEKYLDLGVNRFSVGMQTFDPRFLKVLDRVHSIEMGEEFLKKLSSLKVNFSIDFMLGLPYSEEYKRNIIEELKQALEFCPNHLSVYILTTKDNYCHKDKLPTEGYIEEEYLKVAEFLKNSGFGHYEVSNYALKGFESQHNLRYWLSDQVAALGPSATGFIESAHGEWIRYKWKNKDISFQTENLDSSAMNLERTYLQLRTDKGLFLENEATRQLAESWKNRDLGYLSADRFSLNSRGYLVLDSLMNELFTLQN